MARAPRPVPPVPPVPPAPPVVPPPPAPAPAPVPPVRHRPARRLLCPLFWVVVGALAALFAANLLGYGPAIIRFEQVSVVLPPSQQQVQPKAQSSAKPAKPAVEKALPAAAPEPQATAPPVALVTPPAPAPSAPTVSTPPSCCPPSCCVPPTPIVVTPIPAPQPAFIIGQPQAYHNSWGWWLVDTGGSFHCPPVSNPTSWTGGMKVLVQRADGSPPYETWAPACYR